MPTPAVVRTFAVLACLALPSPLLAAPEAPAGAAAATASPDPLVTWTQLAPTALRPSIPMSPELQTALATRDWDTAVPLLQKMDRTALKGTQVGDHAFLLAWALQRSKRAKEAVPLIEVVQGANEAPPPYVNLVVGEILLADGRPIEAAKAFQAVEGDSPVSVRAQIALAEAYEAAGRTADARATWAALAARPDPSSGSSIALWALARRAGLGSKEAAEYLQRLYRDYPGSAEDIAATSSYPPPTLADIARRGDRLQENGSYAAAKALLSPKLAEAKADDCVFRFAYGRAEHKLNNLTSAAEILEPLGKLCKGKDDDRGAKALYITGKSLERKKDWAGAARAYARIGELYPTHSMADDGYALGGVAQEQAGDLEGARRLWAKGYEAYPNGDLAGENAWRLAFGAWLSGDVNEAIRWADRASFDVPLARSPTDVLGCMYWSARWRAWPSLTEPRQLNPDKGQVDVAVGLFEHLARTQPWHYYAGLAAARLTELAPDRAKALARPPMDPDDAPWQVRDSFRARPAVRNGLALIRVGLLAEALAELDTLDEDELAGSEMAILTGTQASAGKFLAAHDRLRSYLKTHPPETLGPNAWKVMRQAYPNQYWEDVQKAAAGYAWDARVFHALVREESNFNPQIKSHAGACGLSQLMPGTASGCAKKMGLAYSSSKIWDVATNLKIGSWYLDTLHSRYGGNSALALAAYNAGEGNVDRWMAARPDAPTDLLVETITFRETRHYVKRVLSTFQTYRLLYGQGPLFADWSRFNHDAVP